MKEGFFNYIKCLNFGLRFQAVCVTFLKKNFIDRTCYFLLTKTIQFVVWTVYANSQGTFIAGVGAMEKDRD